MELKTFFFTSHHLGSKEKNFPRCRLAKTNQQSTGKNPASAKSTYSDFNNLKNVKTREYFR